VGGDGLRIARRREGKILDMLNSFLNLLFIFGLPIVASFLPFKFSFAFFLGYVLLFTYCYFYDPQGTLAFLLALMLFSYLIGFAIFSMRLILHMQAEKSARSSGDKKRNSQ
jgi:hypothetical protein